MQYYKTFSEFEDGCKALEARIKSIMLKLPVGSPRAPFSKPQSCFMQRFSKPSTAFCLIGLCWQRAAKEGEEALKNPDDTYDWAMRLMDTVLMRVDAAVDEGNKNLEKMKTPKFWSSQVSSFMSLGL